MAAIHSLLSPNIFHNPTRRTNPSPLSLPKSASFNTYSSSSRASSHSISWSKPRTRTTLLTSVATADSPTATAQDSESARRLYVGNIPRDVDNQQLEKIFAEHGSVQKAEVMYDKYSGRSRRFGFVTMSTIDDANVAIEKLNDTEVGGRQIKVNVTEKPLQIADPSLLQSEESTFVDSPHKVYVGNLAKTVTSDILSKFFAEKGKVLSAKISRAPGTSKSRFGFVSFSSDQDVEAAISSFNNALLEGQKIRVNKA